MRLNSLIAAILLLAGCTYNQTKGGADAESQGREKLSAEELSTPDFKTVQRLVFNAQCTRCHGAGKSRAESPLEDYPQIRRRLTEIYDLTVVAKTMPKDTAATTLEIEVLRNWIESGAPENVAIGEKPDPSLAQGPDDWNKVRDKVLAKRCTTCHSGEQPAWGLDTSNRAQVKEKILQIIDSSIINTRMPVEGLPTLTFKEKDVFLNWISRGMPE